MRGLLVLEAQCIAQATPAIVTTLRLGLGAPHAPRACDLPVTFLKPFIAYYSGELNFSSTLGQV